MSVQTEIDRISTAVQNAHLKVIEKGGTSAAPYLVANLPDAIDTIPEATEPELQAKTVSPATSAQTVKPDSGYDGLSQVTVNAMPTATQATPAISVSSAGLITASATQTAGYVAAGTKSATKQLTAQAAQTITPGTADKTIPSGQYLTGTQTIKGDANLVAGNIKSGVSIFGVEGTMTAGEDVTAETETYTDLLTDLEAAIDELPDAGSGSGGAAIETCTVVVNLYYYGGASATCYENGQLVVKAEKWSASPGKPVTFENVVCGSCFTVSDFIDSGIPGATLENAEEAGFMYANMRYMVYPFKITAPAGGTATITIYDAD